MGLPEVSQSFRSGRMCSMPTYCPVSCPEPPSVAAAVIAVHPRGAARARRRVVRVVDADELPQRIVGVGNFRSRAIQEKGDGTMIRAIPKVGWF